MDCGGRDDVQDVLRKEYDTRMRRKYNRQLEKSGLLRSDEEFQECIKRIDNVKKDFLIWSNDDKRVRDTQGLIAKTVLDTWEHLIDFVKSSNLGTETELLSGIVRIRAVQYLLTGANRSIDAYVEAESLREDSVKIKKGFIDKIFDDAKAKLDTIQGKCVECITSNHSVM